MANDSVTATFQGTLGFANSLQDVENAFSATLSTYGGTVSSTNLFATGLTIVLSLPDTKTVAQLKTLISDIASDLGGEFNVVGTVDYWQVMTP